MPTSQQYTNAQADALLDWLVRVGLSPGFVCVKKPRYQEDFFYNGVMLISRRATMFLREIHVQGFRSLRDVRIQFQDRLTILVGENNTGKTALLDIIDLVLNSCDLEAASKIPVDESRVIRQPDFTDYTRGGNSEIIVSLTFEKREGDDFEEDAFKVYYRPNQQPIFYEGRWGQIIRENAFGLVFYNKKNIKRPEQDHGIKWEQLDLIPEDVDDPDVRCYSLADYANTIVRYFRPPYLQHLQGPLLRWIQDNLPQEGEITALWQRLQELLQRHVQAFLNQSGLLQHLQAMLHGIPIEFKLKFCDYNDLLQEGIWYFDRTSLSKMGKGVQQLLSLGIIEWWIQQVHEEENTDILLLLDEPDAFLHFEAQRYFFRKLKEMVLSYPFLQVIMTTHSVVMIDAADVRQIVRFSKNDKGETEIRYITTSAEQEVHEFLSNIASLLGITNSSLLYQRCFVIVEGETERTFLSFCTKSYLAALYKRTASLLYRSKALERLRLFFNCLVNNGSSRRCSLLIGTHNRICTIYLSVWVGRLNKLRNLSM